MAANQTNRETISSSFHLPSTEQQTMMEIEILKHKIKTLKKIERNQMRQQKGSKNWIKTEDASDLQGEKGCDITKMPQMQITH